MTWFNRLVFIGLFAFAVPWAQPQANLLPLLPSGQIAPSDSAIQSGSVAQSGFMAPKKDTQKPSSVSNIRSMLATGSVPAESQGLCFQPGIGWQRLPRTSNNSAQKTSPTGSSIAADTDTAVHTLPSGVEEANSDLCAGNMAGAIARSAAVKNIVASEQSQSANSNRPSDASFGVEDWLNADTLLNPASSSASTRLMVGLASSLSTSKHFIQGAEGSYSIQEFETHSYVSPIKLRRMMRSAPDLETRLKLRRLTEKVEKKSGKSGTGRASLKNNENQSRSNDKRPGLNDTSADIAMRARPNQ